MFKKLLNKFAWARSHCRSLKAEARYSHAGFTLVETLIYLTIVGVVVVSFVTFSINISSSRAKVYVEQEVQANARVALDMISQRLRSSSGVNTGTSTFDTDPGVLSLATTTAAANPMIFSLSANDGVLQLKEGTASPVTITSDEVRVTNLVFTDLTATSTREHIRVELTLEYATSSDNLYEASVTAQTAVSLRQ
jgi:type II secretory pathway pseudopilin PulG